MSIAVVDYGPKHMGLYTQSRCCFLPKMINIALVAVSNGAEITMKHRNGAAYVSCPFLGVSDEETKLIECLLRSFGCSIGPSCRQDVEQRLTSVVNNFPNSPTVPRYAFLGLNLVLGSHAKNLGGEDVV